MARTGYAHLPLHGGKAPRYLFERIGRSEKVAAFRRLAQHQ